MYAAQGYPLTAATAFPALALFNLLRFPVMVFPSQIASLVQGKVALKRIQDFVEVRFLILFGALYPYILELNKNLYVSLVCAFQQILTLRTTSCVPTSAAPGDLSGILA